MATPNAPRVAHSVGSDHAELVAIGQAAGDQARGLGEVLVDAGLGEYIGGRPYG
jgi:hypothetical protein